MGKPTGKRKSDGDLPPIKRSRKVVELEEEGEDSTHAEKESSDGFFVREQQRPARAKRVTKKMTMMTASKSRRSEPVWKLAQGEDEDGEDEEEEDQGGAGMESQQFLQLVSMQQEKKTQFVRATEEFVTNFQNAVEENERVLKKQIERLSKESIKRDANFLSTFEDVFIASRPKAPPAEGDTPNKINSASMVFASLYNHSLMLVNNANAIVQKFEEADEITKNIELSELINTAAWEQGVNRVEEILDVGKRVGMKKFERRLNGTKTEVDGNKDVNEEEMGIGGMFYQVREGDGTSRGWGGVARRMEKATRKLVKILPVRVEG